jgi:hypothetical protein
MGYIQGEGRSQGTLFPAVLDDLVPADHVCRVIDARVALALGDRGDCGPQLAGRSPRSSRIGPDIAHVDGSASGNAPNRQCAH